MVNESYQQNLDQLILAGGELFRRVLVNFINDSDFNKFGPGIVSALDKMELSFPFKFPLEAGSLVYSDYMNLPDDIQKWVRDYLIWFRDCEVFFEKTGLMKSEIALNVITQRFVLPELLRKLMEHKEMMEDPKRLAYNICQVVRTQVSYLEQLSKNPP